MAHAAHWVPLNVKHHGGLMWQRFTAYHFAQHITQASLAEAELPHAAASFPIGFTQTAQSWQAVALLGLRDEQNLIVDSQGRWRAAYVPAALHSPPSGCMLNILKNYASTSIHPLWWRAWMPSLSLTNTAS